MINAAGLYVLNEFDNIVLMLLIPCRKREKDEECQKIIDDKINKHDRIFASIIGYCHIIFVLVTISIDYTNNFVDDLIFRKFVKNGPYGYFLPINICILYVVYYSCIIGIDGLKKDLFTIDRSDYCSKTDNYSASKDWGDSDEDDSASVVEKVTKKHMRKHEERIAELECQVEHLVDEL